MVGQRIDGWIVNPDDRDTTSHLQRNGFCHVGFPVSGVQMNIST